MTHHRVPRRQFLQSSGVVAGSALAAGVVFPARALAAGVPAEHLPAWNELLFSLVLSGRDTRILAQLPLTFSTDRGTEWGMVMAAGSLTLLPVIAFALLVQRHILRGKTLGAVKG